MNQQISSLDLHGIEWRNWILENLKKNCSPSSMFEKMVESTWDRSSASKALYEALEKLSKKSSWHAPLPQITNPTKIESSPGKEVRVLAQIESPHALVLDGVLTSEECEELIEYAYTKGLKRSNVVDGASGKNYEHDARTSSSVFFTRAETPLIDTIELRLAALTNWPIENGEGLQLLQYEPGQEYKAHFDWFDPKNPGSLEHLQRGGQRAGTMVIYLQAPKSGGVTRFPKSGVEVSPNQGGAVFFSDLKISGEPDEKSLHSSTPVTEGTKIVLTYWQRERAFVSPNS